MKVVTPKCGVKLTEIHDAMRSASPAQPAMLREIFGDSDISPKHTARVTHLGRNPDGDLGAEALDREGYVEKPQSHTEARMGSGREVAGRVVRLVFR